MRDFRDAKAMAKTLRASLVPLGHKISVGQSLELIAKAFGVADWNTLSAAIQVRPALENPPPPDATPGRTRWSEKREGRASFMASPNMAPYLSRRWTT